jgi:inner membrane protein
MLLRVEDYALLIGSLAAFFMLSGLMYMTRNVDWSGYKLSPDDPDPAPKRS